MFSLSAIVIFIAVLGLLVLIHETGHAIAARFAGVIVEEFGIGFPPRLFSRIKKQTLYTINLIPLGGFVRLKGIAEHVSEHQPDDEKEGNFQYKKIWVRLLIVSAGIVMNALVAVVLFTITLSIGFQQPTGTERKGAVISSPHVEVASLVSESAAANAGVQPGDRVTAINSTPVQKTADFQALMSQLSGTNVALQVVRNEQTVTLTVVPGVLTVDDKQIIGIGVGLQDTNHVRYPWYRAPAIAVELTAKMTSAILSALGTAVEQLFVQQQIPDGLTGPVGIAVITGQVAESGVIALLQFSAILSINLALFNVLPIPALDGGRLFFLFIELITRKKVNQRVETIVHQLGFVLLITLMILVTYRDIIHLH